MGASQSGCCRVSGDLQKLEATDEPIDQVASLPVSEAVQPNEAAKASSADDAKESCPEKGTEGEADKPAVETSPVGASAEDTNAPAAAESGSAQQEPESNAPCDAAQSKEKKLKEDEHKDAEEYKAATSPEITPGATDSDMKKGEEEQETKPQEQKAADVTPAKDQIKAEPDKAAGVKEDNAAKAKPVSAKVKPAAGKAKAKHAPAKAKAKPKASAAAAAAATDKQAESNSKATVEQPKADQTKGIKDGKIPGHLYSKLHINIVSARDLRNADEMDGSGLSDPFCVVEIPGKPGSLRKPIKFQTRVLDDTCDPVWHYAADISGWTASDMMRFTVWDKDTFSADDLLGKAELRGDKIEPAGFSGELRLHDTSETAVDKESFLEVHVHIVENYIAPKPVPLEVKKISEGKEELKSWSGVDDAWRRPNLFVTLVSARNLRNADGIMSGVSDPYCICEIPGKHESRIQSPVIDDKLDPVWNYRALVPGYELGDSLSLAVFDKDDISADDLLGRVKVTKDKIVNQFSGELQLTDTGWKKGIFGGKKELQSFITIKIETEELPEEEEK